MMPIFFIAALGLLLLFLFLRRLSEANTRVLSDVLKGVSATLLLISFILFILSGRVVFATLLLGIVCLFFFSYRSHWHKKSPQARRKFSRPLTLQEALAALDLETASPLSLEDIEAAYQEKKEALQGKKKGRSQQEKIDTARDLLRAFVQKEPTPFSDFL